MEHDFWDFSLVFFFLIKQVSWYRMAIVEDFFVFEVTYRGQAVTTEDNRVIVSSKPTRIHTKSPLETEMSETIFTYKCYFFGHPAEFVEKKLRHEWYHGSFEALFTQIVAPRTEKPRSDIGLEGIGYHEDETFSTTAVEKRIMENECF